MIAIGGSIITNVQIVMSALSFARQAFGRGKPHVRGLTVTSCSASSLIGGFSPQSLTGSTSSRQVILKMRPMMGKSFVDASILVFIL